MSRKEYSRNTSGRERTTIYLSPQAKQGLEELARRFNITRQVAGREVGSISLLVEKIGLGEFKIQEVDHARETGTRG